MAGVPPEGRKALYADAVGRAVRRLLGSVDRGRHSPTAGSFDRDHWAWKMRDHPIGMLQMGLVPLAKLAAAERPGFGIDGDRLVGWIELGVTETLRRQHSNGAFDSVGPFTQDHGMTIAAAWVLATVGHRLESRLPEALVDGMRAGVRRACEFGLRSEEDYAFISNHHALFSLGFHEAGRFLQDPDLGSHADRIVYAILRRQSADGWYEEYGGPDPGYETLGIHYLAELWEEREPTGLLDSLGRSLDFLSHCIHPDGSLGGVYGRRRTRLWIPGGIERLAPQLPVAEAIAARVAGALERGAVVTLDAVDHHNLPPFLGGYVTALACLAGGGGASGREVGSLPCDTAGTTRHFEDSGLTAVGRAGYYAVFAGRTGGVGVAFDRAGRRLLQDTGYRAEVGGAIWTSQVEDATWSWAANRGEPALKVQGRFVRALETVLGPWSHLLLRILNLTLFRSVRLGAWVRSLIVRRIITRRDPGSLAFVRTIRFHAEAIEIEDVVENGGRSEAVVEPTEDFLPIHMGSARYFATPDWGHSPREMTKIRLAPGASHTFRLEVRAERAPAIPPEGSGAAQ